VNRQSELVWFRHPGTPESAPRYGNQFALESFMAVTTMKTSRGRKQDRARVAGGQDYEVRYEAKKTGRSAAAVKKTVKKVGTSRKQVEKTLGRGRAR
jgi:hypothetical protein